MVEQQPSKIDYCFWKAYSWHMTKICCTCKQSLPEDSFSWRDKKNGKRSRECRACHAVTRKANYEKNKQRDFDYVYERRKKLNAWLKSYKSSLVCERCGENHPATIDFHHKNPAEKDINLSIVVKAKGWSPERIMNEIKKCEVLCANCHRKEHWRA